MVNLIIWGRGNVASEILEEIKPYEEVYFKIIGVIDRDTVFEKKINTYKGHLVISLEDLFKIEFDYIVICSDFYDDIKRDMEQKYCIPLEKIKSYEFLGCCIKELRPIRIKLFYDDFFKKIYGKKCNKNMPSKIKVIYEGSIDNYSEEFLKDILEKEIDYVVLAVKDKRLQTSRYNLLKSEKLVDEDIIIKYKFEEKYSDTNNIFERSLLNRMKVRKQLDTYYFLNATKKYNVDDTGAIQWNNKRLFVGVTERTVYDPYTEQIENSPHKYENPDLKIEVGDVLVDIGACEGNFSLYNIELVKKVYIVECEDYWIENLEKTFAPYNSKAKIISKFVSDKDNDNLNQLTLDSMFEKQSIDFLKMDIEGSEYKALEGAKKLLSEGRIKKLAVCSYHRHNDKEKIMSLLKQFNYYTWVSDYKMVVQPWFDNSMYLNPEFRNGIVWGKLI